jgi:hypothetical protein
VEHDLDPGLAVARTDAGSGKLVHRYDVTWRSDDEHPR